MVVAAGPFAIAGEGAPAAMGAVAVVFVGRVAAEGRGRTLPEHGIGGVPTCAKLELFEVGEEQVAAVDVHDVEQQTGGP